MKSHHRFIPFFALSLLLLAGSCAPQPAAPATQAATLPAASATGLPAQEPANTFFDDFSYTAHEEMTSHGWTLREGTGWPGVVVWACARAEDGAAHSIAAQAAETKVANIGRCMTGSPFPT